MSPPIVPRCACTRPARYYDTTRGFLQHLCHVCWRDRWTHELETENDHQ